MVLDLLKFGAFLAFFVFLPGRAFLSLLPLKVTKLEQLLLVFVLGVATLLVLSFGLGWLGTRFLVYPLLLVFGGGGFLKSWPGKLKIERAKLAWSTGAFLVGAIFFQVLVVVSSGWQTSEGIGFWGVQGHDGVWHLTLIQELAQHFPGQNPGFAGASLKNYHFFFDLLGAEIYRLNKGYP